jgi:hypothetical protein
MDRRKFLKTTIGTASVASLVPVSLSGSETQGGPRIPSSQGLDFHVHREYPGERGPKTMLFWDYWKVHHLDNVELVPGRPKWVPEGTYYDPHRNSGGTGRVYFDEAVGKWRKLNAYNQFFISESDDGIHWRPASFPDIVPQGGKVAPHHVFTLPGEGPTPGWLYLDPLAADGYPYKIPVIQSGRRVYERALADPNHRWHELARKFQKPKLHFMDHVMHVSKDGLSWETRMDYDWGQGRFSPEEPHFMFFNHLTGKHTLTVRPGLGDRRVAITMTDDFKSWTEPRVVLQPDLLDGKILEFYAMPVFPYGTHFVGFVWASHFATSGGPDFMVLHKGPQNPQLVYSSDGETFVRPTRTDFIEYNEPGEIGCHSIRPEGMVTLDDEIRIYSVGGVSAHGTPVPADLKQKAKGMLLHTLRRDGFMYFRTRGYWGEFTTRPFAVFDGGFTMNAMAKTGEVRVEIRSDKNEPVEGYTLDDCVPLKFGDSLKHPLQWKSRKNLDELIGKVIRLRAKFYNARVYSFCGDYHFTDAHDARLLKDGVPLHDTSRFGT